ncbi:hypothetical protein [Heliophilum fasciatum]|uniref:Uncharacterized protein n=1 Tax=Heliophilum fasciatum TaxID=35700 RepID=A0A4R2RJL3_9FIRM|nr:hypothetical protein [Heliophilum fasciatum]MCW2278169.1 hypothetical protein [Heliophilum fasciatum]TCP64010.1 hypothetical protein EDD73_11360 [Heliophilum fasciatum]
MREGIQRIGRRWSSNRKNDGQKGGQHFFKNFSIKPLLLARKLHLSKGRRPEQEPKAGMNSKCLQKPVEGG